MKLSDLKLCIFIVAYLGCSITAQGSSAPEDERQLKTGDRIRRSFAGWQRRWRDCGEEGKFCCVNDPCAPDLACDVRNLIGDGYYRCQSCGGENALCCAGVDACSIGLKCLGDLCLECVPDGQTGCSVDSDCCSLSQTHVCNDFFGTCVPKGQCRINGILETPNLSVTEVNEPGFGDLDNKYSLAMEWFDGYIYIGTLNAPGFPIDRGNWFNGLPFDTNGAKLYRGRRNGDDVELPYEFELVFDFGDLDNNNNNFGIHKMLVIEDFLYFVTANHEATTGDGVEVWKTDGVTFSQVNDAGFNKDNNISGRSLAACGGYLYVGVENRISGAHLYRAALGADGDVGTMPKWEIVTENGFGNSNNLFISELEIFGNGLYAGTLNRRNGMELWKTMTCDSASVPVFTNVFDSGWPNATCPLPLPLLPRVDSCITNSGVLTLKTVENTSGDDLLFIGTVNYVLGASLFAMFPDDTIVPVFLFGNGDLTLSYIWSMELYQNRLFIGTFERPNLVNLDYNYTMGPPFSPSIANAEFTLFSLDPYSNFLPDPNSQVEALRNPNVAYETTDSFGTCFQYGVPSMAVNGDTGGLVIGTAGAARDGGTLVFEGRLLG